MKNGFVVQGAWSEEKIQLVAKEEEWEKFCEDFNDRWENLLEKMIHDIPRIVKGKHLSEKELDKIRKHYSPVSKLRLEFLPYLDALCRARTIRELKACNLFKPWSFWDGHKLYVEGDFFKDEGDRAVVKEAWKNFDRIRGRLSHLYSKKSTEPRIFSQEPEPPDPLIGVKESSEPLAKKIKWENDVLRNALLDRKDPEFPAIFEAMRSQSDEEDEPSDPWDPGEGILEDESD